jgi:hypothetical protein
VSAANGAHPNFTDWLAIANLKARYCRLLDTKDWTGWAELFTPDFLLDTSGSGGPSVEGREATVAMVRRSIGEAITTHHVHSPEIVIEVGTANAIWPDGRSLKGAGHYRETYRREDGIWRIASSALTRLNVEQAGFRQDN